jgi:hypothetical protein
MPSQPEALKHARAAFACEPRINLHRYPVRMTCEDNDDKLTEAVHLVLKKDPFVKANHIRAWT